MATKAQANLAEDISLSPFSFKADQLIHQGSKHLTPS
jgi:hypothetical protein